MATFYVKGKVDFTILVDNARNAKVIKKCLLYMFGFQCGSIHVSKDDACDDNNVVRNSIYQEFISNPNGVHWDVKTRKYRIVNNNLIQCSQGTILTRRIATSVANVVPEAFVMKQEVPNNEDIPISSLHFPSSNFIDFSDSFDEDVYLPVSSDINVSSLFLTLVLDVYLVEDVLSNMNQVQGWSFEIVTNYLKAMSIAPHSSNELKSLNYNKIKIQYVFSLPITFNDNIIFELPPIHLPIGYYRQM
jgi:hypothetical protein